MRYFASINRPLMIRSLSWPASIYGTEGRGFESQRAGDGDRTRMASLEGWSSTIELHPRVSFETRSSLEH